MDLHWCRRPHTTTPTSTPYKYRVTTPPSPHPSRLITAKNRERCARKQRPRREEVITVVVNSRSPRCWGLGVGLGSFTKPCGSRLWIRQDGLRSGPSEIAHRGWFFPLGLPSTVASTARASIVGKDDPPHLDFTPQHLGLFAVEF